MKQRQLEAAPCCSRESLPYLPSKYQNAGLVLSVKGVECYATGNAAAASAVVMVPDFGAWHSGRIRAIADHIASTLGYYVIVPKLQIAPQYEGDGDGDGLRAFSAAAVRLMGALVHQAAQYSWSAWGPKVVALLGHLDGKRVGMVGFGRGGRYVCQASALSKSVLCGVIADPSGEIEQTMMMLEQSQADLAREVRCPMLFMPAGDGDPGYRPGGDVFEAARANNAATRTAPFKEMVQGWVLHGDAGDGRVRRDVERAVELMKAHLARHLRHAPARL